jgi:3-oxoacyl-[acyl-carrier-protein] synthase-1
MHAEAVDVLGVGASTAVGRSAWSSAAAARAGISGFAEHPYMIDQMGEPMRVALAPWLDIALAGIDRLEALLFPAIEQALAALAQEKAVSLRLALSLGLPEARPGVANDLASLIMADLRRKYGPRLVALAAFPNGHAAGLLALDVAMRKLAQEEFDACVVAGVDSYIEPETLEWLEASDQLHGAGELNNAWGFIPGEAAGALCLVRRNTAQRLRSPPMARVLGVGTAHEPKAIKAGQVCTGEGLTQALRGALAGLPEGSTVSDVYCDLNGEPYRADEYGFAAMRTRESFESVSVFNAPADCWGDVAAAGGPLHLALAVIAGLKGYAKGRLALAWASAEGGERAAALLLTSARG